MKDVIILWHDIVEAVKKVWRGKDENKPEPQPRDPEDTKIMGIIILNKGIEYGSQILWMLR